MKILAFSDMHNSESGAKFILETINDHNPDLVLYCGDLTHFGQKEHAQKVADSIPVKTLSVPGNCDPPGLHDIYNRGNSKNIHGQAAEIEGFNIIGWGGSAISLGTPFEFSEDEMKSHMDSLIKNTNSQSTKPLILLTHCPPNGHLDEVPGGAHVGCTSVAEIADAHKPCLSVFGHIHEAQGIEYDKDRKIVFVNCGPAKLHCGAIINIGEPQAVKENPIDNIKVELIKAP
jgi:Icc-related predicted phosphoesterase